MPLDEPAWWYAPGGDARSRLLRPVARLYEWAASRRMTAPPRVTLPFPVVCVGNFTAGGTGKTPLSLHIAGHYRAAGLAPVFLSRGYGGHRKGPGFVDRSLDTARDVGDEPLLLAQAAPVMIARDRAAGARAIQESGQAFDVVIMDDGLQNPALEKTLAIAVVDGRRGVGNGLVIPAGPLRAPLELQLARVDAILVNVPPGEGGAASPDAAQWLRTKFHGPVIEARPEPAGDASWLSGKPLIAFAGIANPGRFYDLLEGLGGLIVERCDFSDHHGFTQADARRLLAKAQGASALLVTTEKDWVRLIGAHGALGELREAARPLPIRLALSGRDGERLALLLDGAVGRRPPQNLSVR